MISIKPKTGANAKLVNTMITVITVTIFFMTLFSISRDVMAKGNFGEGLVGWWLLDEGNGSVAFDSSGLGNDGGLSGGVSFTSDALLGSALDFTSADGALMVPHDLSLEPAVGTIQVWIKVAELQNSDIIYMGTTCKVRTDENCVDPTGISVIGLRITEQGSAYAFVANDDPTTPEAPWRLAVSPFGLIRTDKWHHLAMRWDGKTLDIFVDGVLRDSEPYDPVPGQGLSYHGASPLYFGVRTAWDIIPVDFIGQLDDIRFYGHARRDIEIFTDFITKGHKPGKPRGR